MSKVEEYQALKDAAQKAQLVLVKAQAEHETISTSVTELEEKAKADFGVASLDELQKLASSLEATVTQGVKEVKDILTSINRN